MQILTALVVDEIRENEEGRVDLIGLRDILYFDAMPVILEKLSLFLELEVDGADRGKRHMIEIRVIDPDGHMLKGIPIRFTLPLEHEGRTGPLDPTLFEVPFHRFGPHAVAIRIGEKVERHLSLRIAPRESETGD